MRSCAILIMVSIGCAFLLCTCGGPKVKNLYCDEAFGPETVRSGNLYAGGVAYTVGEIDKRQENYRLLANQLWTEMSENIEDCYIPPNNRLENVIGKEAFTAVVECYENKGLLDSSISHMLKDSFGDKQAYVVLGRIENDEHWTEKKKIKDTTDTHIATHFLACRKLRIRMEVFDVIGQSIAWSGYFNHTDCTRNEYKEHETTLLDVIFGSSDEEEEERVFPEIPGLVWVADDIFKSFAKSLPKK